MAEKSPKSRLVAFLLCFFLGELGIHRFYVGKVGTGLLWLFTAGFLGIGTLVDFIMILCGAFKDKEGKEGYLVIPRIHFGPFDNYVAKNGVTLSSAKGFKKNKPLLELIEKSDIVPWSHLRNEP